MGTAVKILEDGLGQRLSPLMSPFARAKPTSPTDIDQVGNDTEDQKEAVNMIKDKQITAQAEMMKLEKDVNEFKNNKEGKMEDLRVRELLL
jgi:hypothetical protein